MIRQCLGRILFGKKAQDRQELQERTRPSVKHHYWDSNRVGGEEGYEMQFIHVGVVFHWHSEVGKAVDSLLDMPPT